MRDELRPILVGEDPFRVERLWQKMYARTHQHGRRGAVLMGLSGIDIALWDIIGQATHTPLYRLLGAYRDEVQAYASAGFYAADKGPAELAREMAGYAALGFTHMKMKVGRNPEALLNPLPDMVEPGFAAVSLEDDLRRVHAVREAVGPDVKLMIDANNAWTPSTALTMMRELARDRIYWLEEPVSTDDVSRERAGGAQPRRARGRLRDRGGDLRLPRPHRRGRRGHRAARRDVVGRDHASAGASPRSPPPTASPASPTSSPRR